MAYVSRVKNMFVAGTMVRRGEQRRMPPRPVLIAISRRAIRMTIFLPGLFALGTQALGDTTVATFGAFGCFAMIGLVEFGGALARRVQAQALLALVGAFLVVVGTVVSQHALPAVLVVGGVTFLVLQSGVISSVLSSASTSLLLPLLLSVSLPDRLSTIPARLEGWGLAAGASFVAILLIWPAPVTDPLRTRVVQASAQIAGRLRYDSQPGDGVQSAGGTGRQSTSGLGADLDGVRSAIRASPRPFTGLGTSERLLNNMLDQLGWVALNLSGLDRADETTATAGAIHEVRIRAGDVLQECSDRLTSSDDHRLRDALTRLDDALADLRNASTQALSSAGTGARAPLAILDSVSSGFRAATAAATVATVAATVRRVRAADSRSGLQRLFGVAPAGTTPTLISAEGRVRSHLQWGSVWLHNSVRGAVALGTAVLIAQSLSTEHTFWVLLAAMTVLRTNALVTSRNAVRGLVGTGVGLLVGSAILNLFASNETALWIVFPIAVLLSAAIPGLFSFAAGQAAFTVMLLTLFNIGHPQGFHLGLIRLEDVAIAFAIGTVGSAVFWPRGATSAIRQALSEAYVDAARFLDSAVVYAVLRGGPADPPSPVRDLARADASARRLDDAFRTLLIEGRPESAFLADVSVLAGGVAALTQAAQGVLTLWPCARAQDAPTRPDTRADLLLRSRLLRSWYEAMAEAMASGEASFPVPLALRDAATVRLAEDLDRDLRAGSLTSDAALSTVWTADHLSSMRAIQPGLLVSAQNMAQAPSTLWRSSSR